jgi:hypothetical protein
MIHSIELGREAGKTDSGTVKNPGKGMVFFSARVIFFRRFAAKILGIHYERTR